MLLVLEIFENMLALFYQSSMQVVATVLNHSRPLKGAVPNLVYDLFKSNIFLWCYKWMYMTLEENKNFRNNVLSLYRLYGTNSVGKFVTNPCRASSYPRWISILRLTGQQLVININLTRYTSSSSNKSSFIGSSANLLHLWGSGSIEYLAENICEIWCWADITSCHAKGSNATYPHLSKLWLLVQWILQKSMFAGIWLTGSLVLLEYVNTVAYGISNGAI